MTRPVDWNVTCPAVPLQAEGRLDDGRYYYFRYRFGRAGIGVGDSPEAAVEDWYRTHKITYGEPLQGSLDDDEIDTVWEIAWQVKQHTKPQDPPEGWT